MKPDGEIAITEARSPADFRDVADMVRAYLSALRAADPSAAGMLDAYLETHDIDAELDNLPTHFTPPSGAALLARAETGPVGLVMLSRKTAARCEMNRMFVSDAARGTGLGRRLCEEILGTARAMGFGEMVLETMPFLTAAIALYRSVGFVSYAEADKRFVNLRLAL